MIPTVTLQPGHHKRARYGYPWVYSNEIRMDAEAKKLPRGSLVSLEASNGEKLGIATFNPHTLIAARILDRNPAATIDEGFIATRLKAALELRERLYPGRCYRLIHAEADGLPGLIVDRYGDAVSLQANTAGMELLLPAILGALDTVLQPSIVVLRNDSPARGLEGVPQEVKVAKGSLNGPVELTENGARFLADLEGGQKTGWFYDQRDNRAAVGRVSNDARVLDLYTYGGGFAVATARGGAREVTAVDRSEGALELASKSAALNGVSLKTTRAEVFEELERLGTTNERFDVVVADPPAFVKSRKDLGVGSRGYRKLARLSAAVTAPGGFLFIASCSHHMERPLFDEEVKRGIGDARRSGRILLSSGAAADHPVHPSLPESVYLKGSLIQLD